MKHKNILFLVEGESTEKHFISKAMKTLSGYQPHQIVTTGHEFYQIARELISDHYLDTKDLIIELLGEERTEGIRELYFTDIILVYDFDAQSNQFSESILRKAQKKFSNSTEDGQLFLSYPMFEAYYHIKRLPDYSFLNQTFSYDLGSANYKNIVHIETEYNDPGILLKKNVFGKLIYLNVQKLNHLLQRKDSEMSIDSKDFCRLLDIQLKQYHEDHSVFVINTFILFFWTFSSLQYSSEY
ncbi:MAG: hypothetical protein GX481_08560 [Atopobium sp.]|nr:hypothetical protein [Atopobium sp.]